MRITGGRARGIPLRAPAGPATRPATDRLREAVFSSLGPAVEGARVADLFAGTGAYGLEALSRGAASTAFYETGREALACLRRNLESVLRSCNLNTDAAQVVARDAFAATAPPDGGFDLVFADPPYDLPAVRRDDLFATAARLAAPEARLVIELPGDAEPAAPGWTLSRRLGKPGRDRPGAALFQKT